MAGVPVSRMAQVLGIIKNGDADVFPCFLVARKLAVLLHALWNSGEVYEPFRQSRKEAA